jgi:hypothetical protein
LYEGRIPTETIPTELAAAWAADRSTSRSF